MNYFFWVIARERISHCHDFIENTSSVQGSRLILKAKLSPKVPSYPYDKIRWVWSMLFTANSSKERYRGKREEKQHCTCPPSFLVKHPHL